MTRRLLLCLLAMAVFTAGCGSSRMTGLYSMPLPGGADLGADPYTVTVRFAEVSDLVPQAMVKVNDVAVGKVTAIRLEPDNRTVSVTAVVNSAVRLPSNAVAALRQTSLLGEKFVEIAAPTAERPVGRLGDAAVIEAERTRSGAEIEEVLGALSLVLSGGGVEQIGVITSELNSAFSGNEKELRSLLSSVDTLLSTLDRQRAAITRAVDGLARLSGTLAGQRDTVRRALRDLAPGLAVLDDQHQEFVRLLRSVDRLGDVAVGVVREGGDDLIADLAALAPTVRKLAEAGDALPKSLELVTTFPLPDAGMDIIKGDFANAMIDVDFNLDSLLRNLNSPNLLPRDTVPPRPLADTGETPVLPLPLVAPPPPQRSVLDTVLGGF